MVGWSALVPSLLLASSLGGCCCRSLSACWAAATDRDMTLIAAPCVGTPPAGRHDTREGRHASAHTHSTPSSHPPACRCYRPAPLLSARSVRASVPLTHLHGAHGLGEADIAVETLPHGARHGEDERHHQQAQKCERQRERDRWINEAKATGPSRAQEGDGEAEYTQACQIGIDYSN